MLSKSHQNRCPRRPNKKHKTMFRKQAFSDPKIPLGGDAFLPQKQKKGAGLKGTSWPVEEQMVLSPTPNAHFSWICALRAGQSVILPCSRRNSFFNVFIVFSYFCIDFFISLKEINLHFRNTLNAKASFSDLRCVCAAPSFSTDSYSKSSLLANSPYETLTFPLPFCWLFLKHLLLSLSPSLHFLLHPFIFAIALMRNACFKCTSRRRPNVPPLLLNSKSSFLQ